MIFVEFFAYFTGDFYRGCYTAYQGDIEKLGLAVTKPNFASNNSLLGTLLIDFGRVWEPVAAVGLQILRFTGIFIYIELLRNYVPHFC